MARRTVSTPPPDQAGLQNFVSPGSPLGLRWACTYPGQAHVIVEPISGRQAAVWLWMRDNQAALTFLQKGYQ